MDIVLLCAGTSSRMGKTNKMLLPVNNTTMAANSAMQALTYLENRNDSSSLIIVTGYRHFTIEKALKPVKEKIERTESKVGLIIVHNKDYRKGQFSSVKTGVKQIKDNKPFFIALGDMPKITDKHYKELESKLGTYDAARVVVNNIPGHPVLLAPQLKEKILKAKTNSKVCTILRKCNVNQIKTKDTSWICDIDTQEDLINLD